MAPSILVGIAQNAAFLLAMAVVYDLVIDRRVLNEDPLRQALVGLVVGFVGIAIIATAFVLEPGIIFDTRSVLLGVTGLFFGVIPTLVAVVTTATYRIFEGGAAVWTGVSVILASGGIGLAWRKARRAPLHEVSMKELYVLGVVLHVVMLGLMFTLPPGTAMRTLSSISLPVLLIYPLATTALGGLLARRLRAELTARAHVEREKALRLRSAALEAAANAIMITDPRGTIEWVNPAFSTLTGFTQDEATGMSLRDLVCPDTHDTRFLDRLQNALLVGTVWRGEITCLRKNGTRYLETQTITPLRNSAGAIEHFIAIKEDLTAQKEMEGRFHQAQKMEDIGRLAGGVAHDFNNLLTVINGTLDLALDDLDEGAPLRLELKEVRLAGERASTLTRQLLAFSRRQVLRPEVLDLNQLLVDMAKMLGRLIGEDVTVVTKLSREPEPVLADPGQLEQVVVNLVVNARDAMPRGGTLTIETRNVGLPSDHPALSMRMQPGRYVRLTIRDTGVGMSPEIMSKVFEPFFTTKAEGKGTGLGLTTVYGIVTQSGGSVTVDSEPNAGTTFQIHLPHSRVDLLPSADRRSTRLARTAKGVETILLVEDEAGIRRVTRRILEKHGYIVLAAESGDEALRILKEREDEPIHLVLTDVVMPGMTGPQLVERIAPLHPGIRVLFASGYTEETLTRHGVDETYHHFINKPYTIEGLTGKIRSVLDERVQDPPLTAVVGTPPAPVEP